jgi:hypothetical protein
MANKQPRSLCSSIILAIAICIAAMRSATAADSVQHWALLIGVNDYDNVKHLRYCVADQEALAKQLKASGFPSDQVFVLDDVAKDPKFRPSKSHIERQLDLVLGMPAQGDTVVLSFSGHGVQIEGKSYICPADCDLDHPRDSMIPLDKVYDALSNCKASLKLLIVDACRNNIELEGKRAADDGRGLRALSIEKPPEGISLLTSCSPGQFAREHDKLGHGVFMNFILKGLAGEAADRDGVVSLFGLLSYTSSATQKYVHDQFNDAQRPYYKIEGSGPVELCRLVRPVPPVHIAHIPLPDPEPDPDQTKDVRPKSPAQDFLEANKKSNSHVRTTSSGLQYEITTYGKAGALRSMAPYYVSFKAMHMDGRVFTDQTGPVLLSGKCIDGFTEAIGLMHEGETWTIWVPPELAYGDKGAPPDVGPNEVLIFEVQLYHLLRATAPSKSSGVPFKDPKPK